MMDETEKAALDAGARAILAPVTGVMSDIIGVAGGDRLAAFRARRKARLEAETERVVLETRAMIAHRKIEPDPDTPPEHLEEILEAARENTIAELRALYARLAAGAADPARRRGYRREFVKIVEGLEPRDAVVLPAFLIPQDGRERSDVLKTALKISGDELAVSLRNLRRLGLVDWIDSTPANPYLTPLGRQFLQLVQD